MIDGPHQQPSAPRAALMLQLLGSAELRVSLILREKAKNHKGNLHPNAHKGPEDEDLVSQQLLMFLI